jgi:hypothetical protein
MIKWSKCFLASLLLGLAITLFSCASHPNNEVYSTTSELTGFKPGATIQDKPVAIVLQSVELHPTWAQAFSFAFHSGYVFWFLLSLALFALSVYAFYRMGSDNPIIGKTKGIKLGDVLFGFLLLVASLFSFFSKPSDIKENNNHFIPQSQYDFYMQRDGSTKAIWDSLEQGHHIVFGKHK